MTAIPGVLAAIAANESNKRSRDDDKAKTLTPSGRSEILRLLASTRHWNGGAGLIVPERVANILKANGIEEGAGYSTDQMLRST